MICIAVLGGGHWSGMNKKLVSYQSAREKKRRKTKWSNNKLMELTRFTLLSYGYCY